MLILSPTVTGCVSFSAFSSLGAIDVGTTSSAVGIKKYKSIIKKNKKKDGKIIFLGKDRLNTMETLISKALIDSYISSDEFMLVNNVLRECNEMKEDNNK